jgi:alkanesulfonate monooxygenase SsuD/methylene tetrahydromethanopterin reductase-like flavin-dependent oxidoreductase (luciferase family)
MKVLWQEEGLRFQGAFYRFEDVLFDPKPHPTRGPPVWIGGYSEAALRRTAALGDAWHGDDLPAEKLKSSADHLRTLAKDAGRSVEVTLRRTVDMRLPRRVSTGCACPR